MLLKSVIFLVLLVTSIITANIVHQADASSAFVTVTSTNSGGITTISVSNSIDNNSDVVSFILQINGGTFKSFSLENGWAGMKTSPTTLAFSAMNTLKPGKSTIFQVKTDQQIPTLTWKAIDSNNIDIGSGNIGTQPGNTQPGNTQPGNTQPGNTQPGNTQPGNTQQQQVRGILDTSTFRIIPSTPALGSHVRVVGMSFSSLANLDLYLGNDKIGSISANGNGNFVSTVIIPDSAPIGGVSFILKDQQGNQKAFSTNTKPSQQGGIIKNVPLTVNFDPIFHRGETKTVIGTATPQSTITFTILDSKGNPLTTLTAQADRDGNYRLDRTIPVDAAFGKYTVTISDGKNQVSRDFSIVTTHNFSVSTSAKKYDAGQTIAINGTSISNQIVTFAFADPSGHQINSTHANVTSSGIISTIYKLEDSAMQGTYAITVTQGNDSTILYFGVGEDPSPPITAKLDKIVYSVTDRPKISVTGPPSSTVNVIIVDPSDKQKFADVINLGPDGENTYSFNLTAYNPGIYSAVVSHAEYKVENQFAVGLSTGTGKISLKTVKDTYLPGDSIIIIGLANPNTLLQISLTAPNGVIAKSVSTFSDKTGHFSSFDFSIPPEAMPGTWKLDGTGGVNHVSLPITVKSTKQGITVNLDRPSGIYTRGDLVQISGTSAGITASVKITIGNNSTIFDTLPTSATNRGDYSTSWQVPRNMNPGIYAFEASSITGKATISVTIQ